MQLADCRAIERVHERLPDAALIGNKSSAQVGYESLALGQAQQNAESNAQGERAIRSGLARE